MTTNDFITYQDIYDHNIGVGDEIAIIGAFFPRIGETKNIPIVRIGTISAMPEVPVPPYGFWFHGCEMATKFYWYCRHVDISPMAPFGFR